jgi:uncharacterized repeat protein (TIGR01451 family)
LAVCARLPGPLNGIFFGWLWETASIRATLTPRLVVSDPAATAVGRYLSDNAVSSAYKNKDGFTSIFLGDVGWTTDMIRPLLTAAGVHIWDPSGDVVHTDGAWLVLHAGSAGARTVSLPAGVTATPLDGQGTPATSPQPLQVSFQRMGETRWFGLTHDSPILSIALTHQGDFIQGQTGATYTVTASNAATAAATSGAVTITDTAPSGIKLVAMAGTGWTCPAGWTTCTRSDVLAAGSNYPPITATVNVAANAASPEVNRVSVTGGGAPGASAMDSTTIAATTLPCGASLSPAGQAFAATGGPGNITVTAPSGCAWSISGLPDWVTITSGSFGSGNGTVAYQATANTGTWRTASFAVGGSAFVVEQSSATLGPLTTVGAMPQVASGGGWETAIVLVNLGTAPAQARLNFFDDKGGAMPLPMSFPQAPLGGPLLGAQLEQTIAPGAEVVIETSGAGMAATAGWAQLQANGGITGYARFNWAVGGGVQEAVVPLESRTPSSFVLSYDQTGGFGTGVAVANVLNQNASVAVTVRDDTGAVLVSDNLQLAAYGHTAYMVADRYPATTQGRGTVEFKTPTGGQIATLAFRASAVGTLSTIPSMAK